MVGPRLQRFDRVSVGKGHDDAVNEVVGGAAGINPHAVPVTACGAHLHRYGRERTEHLPDTTPEVGIEELDAGVLLVPLNIGGNQVHDLRGPKRLIRRSLPRYSVAILALPSRFFMSSFACARWVRTLEVSAQGIA